MKIKLGLLWLFGLAGKSRCRAFGSNSHLSSSRTLSGIVLICRYPTSLLELAARPVEHLPQGREHHLRRADRSKLPSSTPASNKLARLAFCVCFVGQKSRQQFHDRSRGLAHLPTSIQHRA